MELTQEELAEAFGVTVGAVSKWENGNNVPDVLTMMELANFFNISVDELLGFDLSSKNVEDMCESIEEHCRNHEFEQGIREANEAMTRYPHNFNVLYSCGNLYYYKALEERDAKDADNAIRIYKLALNYISQNTSPLVSEYVLKERIAKMYGENEPEKALEQLEEINYNGIQALPIADTLMKLDRRDEALEAYSIAIFKTFAEQYEIANNAAVAFAASGEKNDLKQAIDLVETELLILDSYSVSDRVNYIFKLKSALYVLKGWWLAALGDDAGMRESIGEAYRLATLFDNAKLPTDIASSVKFNNLGKKKVLTYDTMGAGAVEHIDSFFMRKPDKSFEKNIKYAAKVKEYWDALKTKKNGEKIENFD